MKHILLALLVAGLFGCSSSSKVDHTQNEVSDEAKSAIEKAAEQLKNDASAVTSEAPSITESMPKTEEALKEKASAAVSEKASSTIDFPAYEGTESSSVTCSLGQDTRTIKVLNGATGGCGVVYNKMGLDKTVAIANNVLEHCGNTQEKIKGNLSAAGFTCQ